MSYHCTDEIVGSKIDMFQEELIKKTAAFPSLVVEATFLRLRLTSESCHLKIQKAPIGDSLPCLSTAPKSGWRAWVFFDCSSGLHMVFPVSLDLCQTCPASNPASIPAPIPVSMSHFNCLLSSISKYGMFQVTGG